MILEVVEPDDVLACGRVVPAKQLHIVLPAQPEAEYVALALQHTWRNLDDLDRLVASINQPIPRQSDAVALTRVVVAPVLGDAQGGVLLTLRPEIDIGSALRCDLQNEIGRFALIGNHIPVLLVVQLRVDVEGNQQIGAAQWSVAGIGGDPQLSGNERGVGVAEVLGQKVRIA